VVIEFDGQADPIHAVNAGQAAAGEQPANPADVLNEQFAALNKNIDSAVVIQGGKVQTLQSQMSDPSPLWQIIANSYCAGFGIPFTELYGQRTGILAGDQDKASWNKSCKARQLFECTPMLYEFLLRMMAMGQISNATNFRIEWPDLSAASDKDKLENGKSLMEINKSAPAAGQSAPFDENEVRVACGYAKKTDFPTNEGGDVSQIP